MRASNLIQQKCITCFELNTTFGVLKITNMVMDRTAQISYKFRSHLQKLESRIYTLEMEITFM
jgi:hypothetical protein